MQYATSCRTLLLALGLPALVLLPPVLPVPVYTIHDKDDRDVRYKHFVILLHNIKGIYAILSQIWKCRKSRVFGANFWAKRGAGATSFAFCNYDNMETM